MKEFGNYGLDRLIEKGYTPVGRPALLVGRPNMVNPGELEDAIEKTNGDIIYDAIVSYVKTNTYPEELKDHIQIIGDVEGDIHYLIVQALKSSR